MNRRGFFGMLAGLFGGLMVPKKESLIANCRPLMPRRQFEKVLDGGFFRLGYKSPFVPYPNLGWDAPGVWSIVPAEINVLPALRSYVDHCQRRLDGAKEVLKRAESKCLP